MAGAVVTVARGQMEGAVAREVMASIEAEMVVVVVMGATGHRAPKAGMVATRWEEAVMVGVAEMEGSSE
jgi:hypothetical protein